VSGIAIGETTKALKKKRLLTELASIDGAVIFDDGQLLAVGAIIRSHSDAGTQIGARSTAAFSAFRWGGHPIKVSSDGEVTVLFSSKGEDATCDAALNFL
jgi:DNA integrity scanning protein DisA with diadenylate cyclase activity